MSLIIEKFTDEELMGEVFIFFSVGGYPRFYKVYKITKKQVYLVKVIANINFDWFDGHVECFTHTATNNVHYVECFTHTATNNAQYNFKKKTTKKIIKRDEIDDCNWGKTYTLESRVW
jgi:hypothetical protein